MFSLLHPSKDLDAWCAVLDAIGPLASDPHFSPWYVGAEVILGGQPLLATWRDPGGYLVAKPIVLRDVVVGGHRYGRDATSPHGYGGPVSNGGPGAHQQFDEALTEWYRAAGVICEYTAFNPMLHYHQTFLVRDRAQPMLKKRKDVVVVNLTGPNWVSPQVDLRKLGYHENRVAGINVARRKGVVPCSTIVVSDTDSQFVRMYGQAMERKGAAARWRFQDEYLLALCQHGTCFYALVGEDNPDPLSAALVLYGSETAYYHMAASGLTRITGANDLLVHHIALTARENGCKSLHLGGGPTSAPNDPVMFFKSGFSDLRAPAMAMFRVFDESTYRAACAAKAQQEIDETGAEFTTSFEPMYRREAS